MAGLNVAGAEKYAKKKIEMVGGRGNSQVIKGINCVILKRPQLARVIELHIPQMLLRLDCTGLHRQASDSADPSLWSKIWHEGTRDVAGRAQGGIET